MQVASYKVKKVISELVINGSNLGTRRFGHDNFKMTKNIGVFISLPHFP